jgi:hypothetical protein
MEKRETKRVCVLRSHVMQFLRSFFDCFGNVL